ncbi:uncharacterized protein LOC123503946 [Portunus trituberculatus]|uniref:uncharacterized protein LOC123503946 n=1 Tax=Portunus trituberculatus TaxID=210409 RepID=UPI001E1CBDC6|nr:uncharacterized protein LOC123503946 [Portunus trituberculatus]
MVSFVERIMPGTQRRLGKGDSEQSQYQGIKCWLHDSYSHSIHNCNEFVGMSNSDKVEVVKRNRICFSCLKGSHMSKKCWSKRPCNIVSDGQRCGKDHHPLLHEAYIEGLMFHMTLTGKLESRVRDRTLLMMNKLYSTNCSTPLNTLWDPGSDITLVRFDAASRLGLTGKEVTLSVTKVGGRTERLHSREYIIPLKDLDGKIWRITAYGIESITSTVSYAEYVRVLHSWVTPLIKFHKPGSNVFGVRISHIACSRNLSELREEDNFKLKMNLEKFFEIEGLGTYCVPKCGGCKCGSCTPGDKNYNLKEERELALISAGLNHDPDEKCWTVKYPWIREPEDLPNNVSVAVARLKSTEKRLSKLGTHYCGLYNDQIQDMVNRGVARRLSIKELNNYEGPVHYIHHHEVLKPSSSSTPLRIVFNSSASYMGHILNDYWAKGPDVLNSLLGILIRFRQGKFAVTGDISKMYNSVKMGTLDQHTHRFLWRNMDNERPPDHYIMTAVTFGDKPSGVIAMTALKKTVEMYETKFPKVKDVVTKNSYVDDIVHSCDDMHEARQLVSDIDLVLSQGGFKIKQWIMAGDELSDTDLGLLDSHEQRIFGLKWDPREDTFGYRVTLNFSKKFRNVREGPCLTKSNLESQIPKTLTKRVVLSQVSTVYDPWELDDGRFESRLIMAKNRIAPVKQITIPRLELCGAVLSCRLRLTIEKESDWKFQSVLHIVDSSIVRAQIQKESYGFGTFVANRVAEIQMKTDPNDWWWVKTSENPADLTTRPCHPNYLRSNSLWQKGPDFLSDRISEWPISKLCNEDLPDRVGVTLMCEAATVQESDSTLIKIERYSSYNKLLRVTARVIAAAKTRSFKAALCQPTTDGLRDAENISSE